MTNEQLKAKMDREPFRPFIIELTSGRQIRIGQESEVLFPRRRPELIIAFSDDGLQHEFELSAIVSLVEAT
jgi:hypothetical protein